mmetsp:Transcript_33720/g.85241  ORF Transcript_33720/g.85241 Transcript_33720/m.85241 type:complete len:285 (-) Transcript_33720:492-1346(-)|eukprot:CAMPEP_0173471438 /NCGR_PEP_ID=MMETSP1357-20121228/78395_1 /TAXON_ID=77926 /ORGANISM="Hemiselmis rufescens, Strain PCC563" /LENGTH=284 /DNA_ID=CAMNT_0014439747 /DNA_START=146 /DNA_END=1000 /DNA_ORIENTATION=-
MADDLDAFLDEIDTLAGDDGAAADAVSSSSSSHPAVAALAAKTAPPPSSVISQPPVKASEPTKTVYASAPVRNEVAKVQSEHEAAHSAPSRAPYSGGSAAGAPPMMPPHMFPPPSAPQVPPPPVHHQSAPPMPMPHMLPQAGASAGTAAQDPETEKKRKVMRMGGDKIWKDDSMAEWPEDDYRLFCGNLGNEVDDSTLARTFNKYASFQKAKVIRDPRTKKSKGFGFVSLADPADFTRAIKELNGKYVGNRPIKLTKSDWNDRQLTANIKKRPKMNPNSAKKHI